MPTTVASSRKPPGVVLDDIARATATEGHDLPARLFCPSILLLACCIGNASAADDAEPADAGSAEDDSAEEIGARPSNRPAPQSEDQRRSRRATSIPGWEERGGYAVLGGDILLGKVEADGTLPTKLAQRGFGHSRLLDRWPDGIVPFELDESMSGEQRGRVMAAIEHWTENTRMSFAERGSERADAYPNWLRFIPENGCASYVGRATFPGSEPYTGQPLYAKNCTVGSIIHEIGHAVGLYHEHTRPDRDNFISVNLDNVVPGREHNFDIVFTNTQTYADYDYGSIMHYGAAFFSSSGEQTIVAPPDKPIGQRLELSEGDILAADRMYATDLSVAIDSTDQDVSDGSGGTLAGVAIDAAVRNLGSLGAHDVELRLSAGDSPRWLSVSEDSGWQCLPDAAQLVCTRDTLAENDSTRFAVHVDPGAASASDISAALISRTLDLDESNNTVNRVKPKALPTRDEDSRTAAQPGVGAAQPEDPVTAEPTAEPMANAATTDNAGSGAATSAGGGGGGIASPVWLGLLALRYRRRRLRPTDAPSNGHRW